MVNFLEKMQDITWKSPSGKSFVLKTLESGYTRKHIGEVKENPKTTYTSSSSSSSGKKGHRRGAGVSTSSTRKRVGDSNDTFTDLGIGGKDVSLDCLFVGDNHDVEAKAFENALCEIGKSRLRLAYGDEFTVNVLSFSVKHTLVEQINKTTVSVNFHQTSGTTYPDSSRSNAKKVKAAASKTNQIAAQNFENTVKNISKNQTRMTRFTNSYTNAMNKVSNALTAANSITIRSIMNDIMGQSLVTNSLTMASQLQIALAQAVSLSTRVKRLGSGFTLPNNLTSIKDSLTSLLGDFKNSNTQYPLTEEQVDELIINDTIAQAVITSVAQNTAEEEFVTRQDAVTAVDDLIDIADDWNNFVEEEYKKIDDLTEAFERDTAVDEVVSDAVNTVIEKSYELKVEKTIVLTEDEPTVNIAYKYYPDEFAISPEETIEYLISSNDWVDDFFYLVPKGTEVKIYV